MEYWTSVGVWFGVWNVQGISLKEKLVDRFTSLSNVIQREMSAV